MRCNMRWVTVILCAAILALPLWASPGAASKFSYDKGKIQLAQVMNQPETKPATPDSTLGMPNLQVPGVSNKLNPGKALLLSAIIPGAGQFYAHSPIFGGFFLAAEIFSWAEVASYHSKGMSKDTEFHNWVDQYWTYGGPTSISFGGSNLSNPSSYTYFGYEYWVATTYGANGDTATFFSGSTQDWQSQNWDYKLQHLPIGFTHNLDPNTKDQQYYEMVGKYDQFWAGWPADGNYGNFSYDPYNPNNSNPQHWTWDAYTNPSGNWIHNTKRDQYQNMRNASNNALDMSKNFTMVVMGNHILAALHAGFSVSLHNRHLAKEHKIQGALQLEPRKYQDEHLAMASFRVQF